MQSDNDSRVTVVIPAYKATETLRAAVYSCVDENPVDRVIIVCNGDVETFELSCKLKNELASKLNIDIIPPADKLLSAAENWTRACLQSKSKYTKLMCADDLLLQSSVSKSFRFLEDNPNCDFVSTQRRIIDSESRLLLSRTGGFLLGKLNTSVRLSIAVLVRGTNVIGEPSAVLFRTSSLLKSLPWNQEIPYATDLRMYFKVLNENRNQFGFINEPLACFRINNNSWSNSLVKNQMSDFVNFTRLVISSRTLYMLLLPYIVTSSKVNAYLRRLMYRKRGRNVI